jgi:LysR family transcriptional regulator, transcriptional activator for dmlA
MDISDLKLVCAVQTHKSLSGAALALGVSAPVATKRLNALERSLGLRLFQRTTRRVAPTAEGALLCERAALLLAQFNTLAVDLHSSNQALRGPIKLASSLGFGRRELGPALAAFQNTHPQVQLQVQLREDLPDLTVEGFDAAVWLWAASANRVHEWTSRKLCDNRRALVASPAYLQRCGQPTALADLSQHSCLVVREHTSAPNVWVLSGPSGVTRVRVDGPLRTNSGELALDWCLAGHGIMLRSNWDTAAHLGSGALVRVLPDHTMLDADVHWLAPFRAAQPQRVQALQAFLLQWFHDKRWA